MLGREAKIRYLDAGFEVQAAGDYVLCAMTGKRIALAQLRYWSVAHQEAYFDAAAVAQAKQQHDKAAKT